MSRYISLFGRVFALKKPDLLLLLGDRYEMLAIAAAATLHNIPIAHLHGGEVTEGASDDVFRHAISKMSHIHFTSTETHRLRVIQLGENPLHVHNVGALGLDNIRTLPLLDRASLVAQCGQAFGEPYFLVTYHPVTRDSNEMCAQVDQLCRVLLTYSDAKVIVTGANADSGGELINQRWLSWQTNYPDKIQFHYSLGQLRYLSAMKYALAVVGNSSSGIIEAPSMHTSTLNIGKRQQGRAAAESVLHVDDTEHAIQTGLKTILSDSFQQKVKNVVNPYGDGKTTERIIRILSQQSYPVSIIKPFFDLPMHI
jgi:UDP-hydrolysing UDP-N-acetyl-D-glucosamine 2-epimerase